MEVWRVLLQQQQKGLSLTLRFCQDHLPLKQTRNPTLLLRYDWCVAQGSSSAANSNPARLTASVRGLMQLIPDLGCAAGRCCACFCLPPLLLLLLLLGLAANAGRAAEVPGSPKNHGTAWLGAKPAPTALAEPVNRQKAKQPDFGVQMCEGNSVQVPRQSC
jgi:hypothetical protein